MSASGPVDRPFRLTVDGVEFEARHDPEQPGAVHYTRVTPPAEGYGFTSRISTYDAASWTRAMHEQNIRSFLESIDPETGYLEDD